MVEEYMRMFLSSIPRSYPEIIRNYCQYVGKNAGGIELFQLQLYKKPLSCASKTQRYTAICEETEKSKPKSAGVECKTILLMGATGSGKTTLINAMVNYILGVKFEDDFRFLLVTDDPSKESKRRRVPGPTSQVTIYELHHKKEFKIPYSLIIVDTPGYGVDIEQSQQITEAIQQIFKDEKGIKELNAVGFTVPSTLTRLTSTEKNINESISSIFGNKVRDNTSFFVTFADGQTPPVLAAIKEGNIVDHQLDANGQPRHHRFNSSGSVPSSKWDRDGNFDEMFWKFSMKNFESFFAGLASMKSVTLTEEAPLDDASVAKKMRVEESVLPAAGR